MTSVHSYQCFHENGGSTVNNTFYPACHMFDYFVPPYRGFL